MEDLLSQVKNNLILEHGEDDDLLLSFLVASISYAQKYQHLDDDYYQTNSMSPTTRQAVIMLASYFYESRDGATAGFFGDSTSASKQVWNTVNLLLKLDRDWKV